ncbi:inactive protein kinase SELMODRAFT_444075-like [Salvia splendens]|uniref:inactive protein kinase SELMODRAFT_444075-like n=1 Tax=Salvia splendens TaxID=180675 RepID=UPI001C268C1F|nr:inactive protein kinase SELMODRAFT_444075-like [Salvia splendens]
MSRDREGRRDKASDVAKVVVAVKAAKVIPKTALIWTLTHVVQPGDCITLLVLASSQTSGLFWGFPRFGRDCGRGLRRSKSASTTNEISEIHDSCSRMILELHYVYDPRTIDINIKVTSDLSCGGVVAEAKTTQANWVVLDRQLNHEKKHCMEQLQCNFVVMKNSKPNILRLNLVGSDASKAKALPPLQLGSPEKVRVLQAKQSFDGFSWDNEYLRLSTRQKMMLQPLIRKIFGSDGQSFENLDECCNPAAENCNLREVISPSRRAPPRPPPLCSMCQHESPAFGKPPRWFTYAELELATGGFSQANFLAEGGYGSVHRGLLPDGQAVAVKQRKLASSQGDKEFCSEVEVLSCAQHRNVVMLIGFCIEGGRRLLVYEYICNGALDSHLYGQHQETLSWSARQKIAVGAARGLRYLHEECRVGCIVHRDMRPSNILITHDFEPLVGDFGLARWQEDGQKGVDTRVIGTFGYLAPEYTQSGQITEKADVYSFGVMLVELVSGMRAVDLKRPRGQQCLAEWGRAVLEARDFGELIDPHLGSEYSENQLHLMLEAASLCLRTDPQDRPRMSQVLRILEAQTLMLMKCHTQNQTNHQVQRIL